MKKFTLAEYFSISRMILAPVLIILAFMGERTWASWLLVYGLVSDALDGWAARARDETSTRGAFMDSIGDAIIFFGGIGAVVILETEFILSHIVVFSIAFFLYFLQLGLGYLRYGKPTSFHTYSAKASAILQSIFLLVTLFFEPYHWLFYIAFGMSILEAIEEIILIYVLPEWQTDVKGLYWVIKEGSDAEKGAE